MNGTEISKLRERLKLTQQELGNLLNCSPSYISLVESSKKCLDAEQLKALMEIDHKFSLSKYLDIDVLNKAERSYVSKLERKIAEMVIGQSWNA